MKSVLITGMLFLTAITTLAAAPKRPFPQELDFPGCIKPSNITQADMNSAVTSLFSTYKSNYLKKSSKTTNGYLISSTGNGAGGDAALTVSEAHGYGMIIFALMAGFDQDAQTVFDGMFRVFKAHPSKSNQNLMSWTVSLDENPASDDNSATDGDMDIAYALILADRQWGSNGAINYLEEAKKIITDGLAESNFHMSTKRIGLGDWSTDTYDSRSSDWMPAHLRIYSDITANDVFNEMADTIYSLISQITTNYSSTTGLVPDFITGNSPAPDPDGGGTGEENAQYYSYNACRFPWRIATDYAHYGTSKAKAATSKLLGWLRSNTGGNVGNIFATYKLDGTPVNQYNDIVFTAPFAAGAITDEANQQFLNNMWAAIKGQTGSDVYGTALNLMSMLLISGNWWSPGERVYVDPTKVNLAAQTYTDTVPAGTFMGILSTEGGAEPYTYSITNGSGFTVRNDSLFAAEKLSPQTYTLTIKSVDNSTKSVSGNFTLTIAELESGLVDGLAWSISHDSYGETSVDTGSALVKNSTVSATFKMGESDSPNDKWVFGILNGSFPGENLKNSTKITVFYSADKKFNLQLPMASATDKAYYYAELPVTNGAVKKVTLQLYTTDFSQPSNWGTAIPFKLEEVSSISFQAGFEGSQGTIIIKSLLIDGITGLTTPILVANPVKEATTISVGVTSPGNLRISVAENGSYHIKLNTLSGRELYANTMNLKAGISHINLNGLSGNGIVLLAIEGNGKRVVEKLLLK